MPSAPPANVHVQLVGLSSITVKWDPVPRGSRNGFVKGYRVRYRQTFSNGTDGEIKTLSTMWLVTEANLTELKMASIYKIEVAGVSWAGTGVYSEAVTAQTRKFKTV